MGSRCCRGRRSRRRMVGVHLDGRRVVVVVGGHGRCLVMASTGRSNGGRRLVGGVVVGVGVVVTKGRMVSGRVQGMRASVVGLGAVLVVALGGLVVVLVVLVVHGGARVVLVVAVGVVWVVVVMVVVVVRVLRRVVVVGNALGGHHLICIVDHGGRRVLMVVVGGSRRVHGLMVVLAVGLH